MRIPRKSWKVLLLGSLVLLLVAVVARIWIVPAVIVGRIKAQLGGQASIGSWWLGRSSGGVSRVVLRDGREVWAEADRVTTDLSLGALCRGHVAPTRITMDGLKVTLRFDRAGRLLTALGGSSGAGGGGGGPLPTIVVRNGTVTIRQEGRPELVVTRVQGRLALYHGVAQLAARSDDRDWGPLEAYGDLDPSLRSGRVTLSTKLGVTLDPDNVERIPFVPPAVWVNIVPHGAVDAQVVTDFGHGPFAVRVELGLRRATVRSRALDLTASRATGKVIVDGARVRLENVAGAAVDGKVEANGTLDFRPASPHFDVGLHLKGIDVARTPKSWQLEEAGVTGRLTGNARLKVVLGPQGVDFTGTTGEAEVTGGTIEGIPVKALKLVMRAEGNDLQYASKPASAAMFDKREGELSPDVHALEAALVGDVLVAVQGPAEPEKKEQSPPATVRLPKTITTQIELQDVEMSQLIAKAKLLSGMLEPIPITGKLDLKATATIPLGSLRSLKDYAFHGDLALRGASLFHVDVGTLSARIDLADGVLELKKLRGRLENRPNGGPDNPPAAQPSVPVEGPLPPGAFRADLRAELSPPGRLTAQIEGDCLPLGELAAPAFPQPTPLSGLVSLHASAVADLAHAGDPKAWSVNGRVSSTEVAYQGTVLDSIALAFGLKNGRFDVTECKAQMKGQPLTARVGLGLDPPHAFDGRIDVTGWDLASVAALLPSAPLAGALTARADAHGTLVPLKIETKGEGQFDRFRAGPIPLGDVPFRWTTEDEVILVSGVEARPFGGRLEAQARVPTTRGRSIEGAATFRNVDTARLSNALPGEGLKLTGKADGQAQFTIPADVSRLESKLRLTAPDLTIQGIPAEQVQASVRAHKGVLTYDVTAESLGGKVKFQGDVPLTAAPANAAAEGEFRAAGFTLKALWKALGISGAAAHVEGLGAIDANLRARRAGPSAGLWVHGLAEFRDLSWGNRHPLGHLRGTVALTPASWWVEPLEGELLGGPASGHVWGSIPAKGPRQIGFDFRVDRAPLAHVLAVLPVPKTNCDGFGTLHLAGRLDEALLVNAELEVPHARLFGLPVNELRAPGELALTPATGSGRLQVRRWSARVAGGSVRGDATLRIGEDASFQADTVLANLDLELLARLLSDARRTDSGQVSGRISLSGPAPADLSRYRGKVALTLADASLVNIPLFREIDKFLGAARGGLFEAGTLNGTIARKQLMVDQLTLVGRVVQLHVTGAVGFDGQLSLEVLVNTNQIIPETGQALVGLIPGLRNALRRRDEASVRVAGYLSNRLLKLRVGGTVRNPAVAVDPSVAVADTAVAFFAGVLELPLELVK